MEWWMILLIVLGSLICLLVLSIIFYRQFFKRFWDIVLSSIAIIVFSPLLIILTIAGAIAMKGNPFFTQLRPGKDEKIFKLVKFRSMTCEKDENGELLSDDKRLKKYGKFIRKTSLDELPELFNIFIGDMSIIGPRPLLIKDMIFMSDKQRNRHCVKPGLSGLAQVNGRNTISWEKKLEFDLDYLEKISFFGDLSLIIKTIFKVMKKEDTVREGTVSDVDFGDWLLLEKMITKEEYDEIIMEGRKYDKK